MPTLDKYRPEPCLDLGEDAWRSIERTLDLDQPNLGLRSRIARYVDLFLLGPTAKSPIKVNDLRKQLGILRSDTAQLQSHFEVSHDSTDDEREENFALRLILDIYEREALKTMLSQLIGRVDEALRLLPRETRPKDDRYDYLFPALAQTYKNLTSREPTLSYNPAADPDHPYSGPFFEFVVAVLDAIGNNYAQPHQNKALGKRIDRAKKLRRKTVAG